MRKLFTVLTACAAAFALTACGSSTTAATEAAKTEAATEAAKEETTEAAKETEAAEELAKVGDFPSETITLVCPFSAGGGTDIGARNMATSLSEILGVNVVVERRNKMLEYLSVALTYFLSVDVIIGLLIGVVGGMIIGIIPGLGPSVGIALLLPISFSMSPTAALVMMAAMYTCGVYGGSITAVLCQTPGTAASAATAADGYEMTKKGKGMEAISVVTVGSVVGGVIGAICLILFAPALGKISLMFSSLEYFLVACFGMLVVSGLTGENRAKGIFSALLGLVIGCVGMDSITGVSRFTFGQLWLEDGLDSTPILIGLFSVTQVLVLVDRLMSGKGNTIVDDPTEGLKGKRWTKGNTKVLAPTMVRSSLIGAFVGFIPAAGCSIAAWLSYGVAKRTSKNPEEFGKGSIVGITASEAANNAACGGAMIPLFTLGIPGSPVTAIMYGALLMHGLQPGSRLFIGEQAPTTYAIFLGFLFSNILMGIIGIAMAKQMARICLVPNSVLVPIIVALASIGTYALTNSMYEVVIMLIFGLIGYFMRIYGFEPAPLVLGVVLADILESNFRRALIMAELKGGLVAYFFSRPVSVIIVLVILGFALVPVVKNLITKRAKNA